MNNNNNNSIVLGHFLPSSLLQQQSTPIRRLTSTSSDSEDSGVDSSYRQERKIFVGGVPSSIGPEELANFFQSYGQVEEAFIIYDRYTGRHRGFGFVTFADMTTTKLVCSTRIFNLHGRKIECKRALKREEILAGNESDFNNYKSFRPNNDCSSPSIAYPYGEEYRQSMMNSVGGWIVNPSMPQMFHPMFNPQQQYAIFPLSTLMWNHPYQQPFIPSPFIQEIMLPSTMMNI